MSMSLSSRACFALVVCVVLAMALSVFSVGAWASSSCPNEALRSGASAALPDCRAYELVTPVAKNGGYIEVTSGRGVPGGEAVNLRSEAAFAGLEGLPGIFPTGLYTAQRSGSGWTTVSANPSSSQYRYFIHSFGVTVPTDTGRSLWSLQAASERKNSIGWYLDGPGELPVEVGPQLPPTAPESKESVEKEAAYLGVGIEEAGVSADGSRVVFDLTEEALAQWPFAGPRALLEYVGTGNREPMLVGVDNEGKFENGCGNQRLGGVGHNVGGVGDQFWTQNAISADGEKIFFTDMCQHEIFARISNGRPGAHTVVISEPIKADCAACDTENAQFAKFDGASEDGSKVFFSSSQALLGGETGENVYEYDFDAPEGQRVVKVTGGDGTVSEPSPELRGVLQVAPDGSHVYFVAGGVLTTTKNYAGLSAKAGMDNLYLYERDAQYPAGHTVFIATLSPQDHELWEKDPVSTNITPDGRFLVLISDAQLTPDDTSVIGQLFQYDAQSNTMVRVSIGQDGYNNDGNVQASGLPGPAIPSSHGYGPAKIQYEPASYTESLTMSGDGSYVFFTSPTGLTPQALNYARESKGEYVDNVYEYHAGRVYLVSDGQDVSGLTRFVGTDLSGRDVFISTLDHLVAQDTDSNVDIYDARIGGGFPPPTPRQECAGDGCQGPLGGAPLLLSPGSEFQRGGENTTAVVSTPAATQTHAKAGKKTKKKVKKKARKGSKARRSARRAVKSGVNGGRGNG